jgi:Na+/phosphate symporter
LVAETSTAMQVALAHFFFNIFGIIIWYPVRPGHYKLLPNMRFHFTNDIVTRI